MKAWYYRTYHRCEQRVRLRSLKRHLLRGNPVVLVHQMGRAASMTVVNTLRTMELDLPVHHTHWLNPASVKDRVGRLERFQRFDALNVSVSKLIIDTLSPDEIRSYPWRIISVIRDAVARNLSAFFLSVEKFIPNIYRRHVQGNISHDEILQVFLRAYPHEIPLRWFDHEVKDVFGLDVYAQPFPFELDYALYELRSMRMTIIKVESLGRTFQPAMKALLGNAPGQLVHTHISAKEAPYASIYKSFSDSACLPDDYLNRMYDSVYSHHFYRPEELIAFRRKWRGQVPAE